MNTTMMVCYVPFIDETPGMSPLLLSHYRTGKGELIQLDAKDVYEKNFGLNPKGGFSGVRWHIGNSILWSRGCMIVSSNILREEPYLIFIKCIQVMQFRYIFLISMIHY